MKPKVAHYATYDLQLVHPPNRASCRNSGALLKMLKKLGT